MSRDGFWDVPDATTAILKEAAILLELGIEEADADTMAEVSGQISQLGRRLRQFSLDMMLDGDDDQNNAIISINAGAGGTEAQDWAEMLFRMYLRWVEGKGFKASIVDLQPGDGGYQKRHFYCHRPIRLWLSQVGERCPPAGENFSLQRQRQTPYILCICFCLSRVGQ